MQRFGQFTFDPSTAELRRSDGSVVPLEPQPARVLALLVSRAGALVTRDELRTAIWPDGTHVAFDLGLNYCIRHVRAALGDNARQPVFIETVARRGYRFLQAVEQVTPRERRFAPKLVAIAAGLAVALWMAERLEGSGEWHHQAAVGFLQTLHDLVF